MLDDTESSMGPRYPSSLAATPKSNHTKARPHRPIKVGRPTDSRHRTPTITSQVVSTVASDYLQPANPRYSPNIRSPTTAHFTTSLHASHITILLLRCQILYATLTSLSHKPRSQHRAQQHADKMRIVALRAAHLADEIGDTSLQARSAFWVAVASDEEGHGMGVRAALANAVVLDLAARQEERESGGSRERGGVGIGLREGEKRMLTYLSNKIEGWEMNEDEAALGDSPRASTSNSPRSVSTPPYQRTHPSHRPSPSLPSRRFSVCQSHPKNLAQELLNIGEETAFSFSTISPSSSPPATPSLSHQ